MEYISQSQLEEKINAEFDRFDFTRGLKITVYKTSVVFKDGNNWMSYIEPKTEYREQFQPTLEAKKMIQKLLGDMRLKYNLE